MYWAWCIVVQGINDGGVKKFRHLPAPLDRNEINK